MNVMTTTNPKWDEFCGELADRIEFDIEEIEDGGFRLLGNCKAGTDKSTAVDILRDMGLTAEEVEVSLVYFESRGMCDCEILLNVDR